MIRTYRPGLPRTATVLVAAGLLLAGGCEGSNLFEGNVADDPPRVTALTAPATVANGTQLSVSVTATARRGVTLVEIRDTGALSDTDLIGYNGTEETVTTVSTLDILTPLDSLIFIEAYAEGVGGGRSAARRDTVRITGFTAPGAAGGHD
jgi:hypothetical protein